VLLWAGLGIVATTALGLVAKLPDATTDVSPWNHWRMPAIVKDLRPELDEGPVLVTLEYRVDPGRRVEFLEAIHEYGRVRRRDGAYRWGVYRDLEDAGRYVETFLIASWAEHLRQHERSTKADRDVENRLHAFVTGVPRVRHFVAAESNPTG
jgi:transmembrane secretion effector